MNRAVEAVFLAILVYTPLALGGARLWAMTPVYVAVVVMLSLFFLARSASEGPSFRRTILAAPLALFVALAAVSCVYSCYRHATILALYHVGVYVAVYYIAVHAFGKRASMSRLVATIVAMGAVLSFIGLILYLGHRHYRFWLPGNTLSATYMNRDHFAGYLEMAIPLAAGFFCTGLPRAQKALVAFLIALMSVAFILAASRGAWVSLGSASLILVPFLSRRRLLKAVALLSIVCAIILCVALSRFDTSTAAARARTIVEGAGVDQTRLATWMGTIELIRDRPLLGSGLGTFLYAFPRFRPVGLSQHYLMDYAHNDYLQMAAELGLAGLGLALFMVAAVLWAGLSEFFRTGNPYKRGILLGATVGVMSMALHSFVDFNLHIPANAILFVTLAGIIMAMHRRKYE